jgi:hypothetical protein
MSADARAAFLTGLIDDAGLFPPASLPMDEAVATHGESRGGENGWMLARFICPASRLPDLAKWLPEEDDAGQWRVSVILDGADGDHWLDGAAAGLSEARSFVEETDARALVELVEVRLPAAFDALVLRQFLAALEEAGLPHPVTPFLEIASASPLPTTLDVIADLRAEMRERDHSLGAKLRCGGASDDLFPTPARVASFIHGCHRLGVPFKATAGLHHPFRHVDTTTGFVQHGFVNLVGAAVLSVAHDLDADVLEDIVADQDSASFSLTPDGFSWRELRANEGEIREARSDLFTAYGSCSFAEPVEDLTALGILPT